MKSSHFLDHKQTSFGYKILYIRTYDHSFAYNFGLTNTTQMSHYVKLIQGHKSGHYGKPGVSSIAAGLGLRKQQCMNIIRENMERKESVCGNMQDLTQRNSLH